MPKHNVARVHDMLDAACKAVSFAQGHKRSDLESNEVLALALVRLLEIVGEAARYIPEEIKILHAEVPWRQIAATRNRLIHGYFSVDLDIVWAIIQDDLPPLIRQLEAIVTNAE
jgi:uncharacterized protein with HEPN domain